MGAAENISDLRSPLSNNAEETGALKMDDADEDTVGWTAEGPLPMTFGHVRRAHSALAALEAALSAAEPVAWRYSFKGGKWTVQKNKPHWFKEGMPDVEIEPLFISSSTQQPAPSVAVKAAWAAKAAVLRSRGKNNTLHDINQAADYLDAATLSAQVQDVLPNVGKWTDEDRAREWRKAFDTMHRRAMNAENAIGAQVQDESEIVDCLSAGKPFVFDPATNFCHADDGGAPENGIKYVPPEQVQDVAESENPSHDAYEAWLKRNGYPHTVARALAFEHGWRAHKKLPAAPAKQEGGHGQNR